MRSYPVPPHPFIILYFYHYHLADVTFLLDLFILYHSHWIMTNLLLSLKEDSFEGGAGIYSRWPAAYGYTIELGIFQETCLPQAHACTNLQSAPFPLLETRPLLRLGMEFAEPIEYVPGSKVLPIYP